MDRRTFSALAVILIIMSIAFLIYEIVFSILMSETRDISDFIELVYRVVMYLLTIIFVFGFVNDCWCAPPWQWQIGALVLFMAFFNFILLLKGMPWFGIPINMLLNIIVVFLRLVYLPILLILSFAFPFYMLFIREANTVSYKNKMSKKLFEMLQPHVLVCIEFLNSCIILSTPAGCWSPHSVLYILLLIGQGCHADSRGAGLWKFV